MALIFAGCGESVKFEEKFESYRIDSVEYQPIGIPSVANLDARWIAHTDHGKFTYQRSVEVGDSVDVIIYSKDSVKIFDPILDHSEIK